MNYRLRRAQSEYSIAKGPVGEWLVEREPKKIEEAKARKEFVIPPHPQVDELEIGGVKLKSSGSYDDIFPTLARLLPTGKGPGWIVHCGACRGVESEKLYRLFWRPMVCIEPASVNLDALRARMHDLTQAHPFEIKVLPYAIGATNGRVMLNLSYNEDGTPWNESNSIKQPKTHLAQSPELNWKNQEEVGLLKLDTMWENMGRPEIFLNFWDIEGAESDGLQGAQEMLKHTKYFFCEASYDERYEGALTPAATFAKLPGNWRPLAFFGHGFFCDILMERVD